ncbi:starch synthase [Paenibacillus sambharensis]|uniref:Glycogen synthase n=1 Tax=Paenibacillus sambharensis TaxID=1803190 RepID=A0A2W1L7W9_9BACL|nr:glycogen synthase [Paenibacillus sambharensis]PZD96248.1 starch synthase [Paenibacillus sambharensis]
MNVLFAASEAVPIVKTGGLADAAGALPKSLVSVGVGAAVILPAYGGIPGSIRSAFRCIAEFRTGFRAARRTCLLLEATFDDVRYYLIEEPGYFGGQQLYGYHDTASRFIFFSMAVLDALPYLQARPDIIHCHDWQTGWIPYLLKSRFREEPYGQIRTVFTIHSLLYEGNMQAADLHEVAGEEAEEHSGLLDSSGSGSCLRTGIRFADKLTTVSPSYAAEIRTPDYGGAYAGLLQERAKDLTGIVNGLDQQLFNPRLDSMLAQPFTGDIPEAKRTNKTALQRDLGLTASEHVPLAGIVTRLVEPKGLDLLKEAMQHILQETDLQLVALGTGERRYEEMLLRAAGQRPDRVAVRIGFDDALARKIYAASDLYLMPSRVEPCGISQLIAMRYGAVPVVRETGGLKDTVEAYEEYTGRGKGFRFQPYEAGAFLDTLHEALACYRQESQWRQIIDNGAYADYSWSSSAWQYRAIYNTLAGNGKG